MRFIVMHKVEAKMEAGCPPDQRIIENMGALVQESLRSGVFITGAGLHGSKNRVRVESVGGECRVTKGPYAGENELLASYTMLKVRSVDDAVAHAQVFALAMGDAEVEVGPVVEPWDLGLMPKPEGNVPVQVLLLEKADASFENGVPSAERRRHATQKLSESLGEQGAVVASGVLLPSSKGARLSATGAGKRTWVDGPFAESKELIAGFSVLEVPSLTHAIAWADRYAAILVGAEVDVRELSEA